LAQGSFEKLKGTNMIATDEINEINQQSLSSQSREVRHCENCGEPLITVPALKCSECGAVRRLRCFVRRASDCYVAECIDLDIAAEGDTLEAAIKGLQDAIDMHLADVTEVEGGLTLRPSPFLHRVMYYFECAKDVISTWTGRRHDRTECMENIYAVSVRSCHI
jgi:predicted RNase H-like HicB family nuclease